MNWTRSTRSRPPASMALRSCNARPGRRSVGETWPDALFRAHHRQPGSARQRPVYRFVAESVGLLVLGPRHVVGGPAFKARQPRFRLGMKRDQFGVLDPPAAVELLDDQFGVEQQIDRPCPQLFSQGQSPKDGRVLGDVVRLNAQVLRDGRNRRRVRPARCGPNGLDQDRTKRRRAWVVPGRAVGSDN
jgi:hypothetical protein